MPIFVASNGNNGDNELPWGPSWLVEVQVWNLHHSCQIWCVQRIDFRDHIRYTTNCKPRVPHQQPESCTWMASQTEGYSNPDFQALVLNMGMGMHGSKVNCPWAEETWNDQISPLVVFVFIWTHTPNPRPTFAPNLPVIHSLQTALGRDEPDSESSGGQSGNEISCILAVGNYMKLPNKTRLQRCSKQQHAAWGTQWIDIEIIFPAQTKKITVWHDIFSLFRRHCPPKYSPKNDMFKDT